MMGASVQERTTRRRKKDFTLLRSWYPSNEPEGLRLGRPHEHLVWQILMLLIPPMFALLCKDDY